MVASVSNRMRSWLWRAGAIVALAALVFGLRQLWIAASVGAGFAAKVGCSLHFISGQDPDALMRGYIDAELGGLGMLFRLQVDDRSVTARSLVGPRARAVFVPGHGCILLAGLGESEIATVTPRLRHEDRDPRTGLVRAPAAENPAVVEAVEAAFREPEDAESGRVRATTAIVVLHRGELVAERYAAGYGPTTPMLSWSMAKSVLAAVVGVLVGDGRVQLDAAAPVPEWRNPGDPRGAITLDQLLRQSSGLSFDETYGAVNDVSRMLFTVPDTGHFAASQPLTHAPDSHWSYSSGTSNIVARLVADLFQRSSDVFAQFARAKLFEPCGMHSAFFEPDASGTPIGSSFVFMNALDWARFGELHRNDGVCSGRRILPDTWVRYVTTPTEMAPQGSYGAHWWLNVGEPDDAQDRPWPSLPTDAYAALGHSGQYVVVIPSAELVVVRLGLSVPDDGNDGTEELIAALLAALAP